MIVRGVAGMPAQVDKLCKQGFYVEKAGAMTLSPRHFAERFGDVIHVTDVRLRPDVGTYLCSPDSIDQHTDHPTVDFIVWYCHTNDIDGGQQIISDGHLAYNTLGVHDQRELSRVRLKCPGLNSLEPAIEHPLFDPESGRIFFAPWLLSNSLTSKQRNAVAAFTRILQSDKSVRTEVYLHPHETLIIDNRRILHGRPALAPTSSRRLTRYWVRKRLTA